MTHFAATTLKLLPVLLMAVANGAAALPNLAATVVTPTALIGTSSSDGPQRQDDKKLGPKIYKYLRGGTTSFSDTPPSKGAYVVFSPSCYACNLTSNINWSATALHLHEYADEIDLAARQYHLDPALVRAVIHAESGFNARARSQKGAMGLMQLMPGTARDLGVNDALVPGNNIRGGVQYLAGLLARFKNDIALATAAYNAGPEAVRKHAGIPPYAETRVYVQRVKILHQRYRESSRS